MHFLLDDQIIETLHIEGKDIWEYFCSTVLANASDYHSKFGTYIIRDLVKFAVRNGIFSTYEYHFGPSAVLRMIEVLLPAASLRGYWAYSTITLLMNATAHFESIRAHELTVELAKKLINDGNSDALEYLLSKGLDVHVPGYREVSVLQHASSSTLPINTFKMVLDNTEKAKISELFPSGQTIIHCLLCPQVNDRTHKIGLVLANGLNPNISGRYETQGPAIVSAAVKGKFKVVALLLAHGGSADATGPRGENVMVEAIAHGNYKMVRRLRQLMSPDHDWSQTFDCQFRPYRDYLNYLQIASLSGRIDVIGYLLSENLVEINSVSRMEGFTALHIAVLYRSHDALRILLKRGANANIKDVYGRIPIDWALIDGDIEVAGLLLAHGSDIGSGSNWKKSHIEQLMAGTDPELIKGNQKHSRLALEYAIISGNLDSCQKIVDSSGLDPNTITIPSCDTCTPFIYAVMVSPDPAIPQWLRLLDE